MEIPKVEIYCKELERKSSAKAFLNEYFSKHRPATFYKKNNQIQCVHGKNRSIEDLFNLVRTEYPSISFKRFIKILYENMQSLKNYVILFCPDIQKVVLYKSKDPDLWWRTFELKIPMRDYNRIKKFHITYESYLYEKHNYGKGNICINDIYKILLTL